MGLAIAADPIIPIIVIRAITITRPKPGNKPGMIVSILLKVHTTKAPVTVMGTVYNSPCKK